MSERVYKKKKKFTNKIFCPPPPLPHFEESPPTFPKIN